MAAAESISVPSQSKTSKSNFLVAGLFTRVEAGKESLQFWGQRRLELEHGPGHGMHDHGLQRVQEHALQSLPGEQLVEREVAVLVISRNRMLEMREMHADLVCAAGFKLGLDQAETAPAS